MPPAASVDARRFRGVMSDGMLASGDELGISPDKDTIYVLEPDAPIVQHADYAIIGDLKEVVPAISECVREARARA